MTNETLWFRNKKLLMHNKKLCLDSKCCCAEDLPGIIYLSQGGQLNSQKRIVENFSPPLFYETEQPNAPVGTWKINFIGYCGAGKETPEQFWGVFREFSVNKIHTFKYDGGWTEYSTGLLSGDYPTFHKMLVPDKTIADRPAIVLGAGANTQIQRWNGTTWEETYNAIYTVGGGIIGFDYRSRDIFCALYQREYGSILQGLSDGIKFEFSGGDVIQQTLAKEMLPEPTGFLTGATNPITDRGFSEFIINYFYTNPAGQHRQGFALCKVIGPTSIEITGPHHEINNPQWNITLNAWWIGFCNNKIYAVIETGGSGNPSYLRDITNDLGTPIVACSTINPQQAIPVWGLNNRYIIIPNPTPSIIYDTVLNSFVSSADYSLPTTNPQNNYGWIYTPI